MIDNPDNPTPAGSTAKTDTTFSWAAYFVWQGQSPPPTPADFLLVTTVAASTGANVPDSDVGAMSTASDVFGETESSAYQSGVYQNNVTTGRHLVRASVSQQVGRYMATVTLTGTGSAQAANSSTAFPNYGSVVVNGDGYVGGGAKPTTSPLVVAERVDATSPHSARIFYRTEPANATVTTATFTLPAHFSGGNPPPAQTVSNVSGEFSFTFDQVQLPQSLNSSTTSNLTLNWEAQSNDPALPDPGSGTITTTATVVDKNVSGSKGLLYGLTLGEPDEGQGKLQIVPTQSYTSREWSERYSYSLPLVLGSLTLHCTAAWADLQTLDQYQGLPTDIAGWSESHYLLVDGVAQPTEVMSRVTGNAIPAFTNTHWGMALPEDQWFMPSQHIVGVSNCDQLAVFDDNEPAVQVTLPIPGTTQIQVTVQ